MTNHNTKHLQSALLLVATLGVMSGITIVSSLPLIAHTFDEVPNIKFLSKLMLTIPSMVIAFFSFFAGHIVDKFGRLKPLYIGIFLFIVGGSSGLYLHDFYAILVGRAILGLGVSLIMTSSTALIGDYFSEEVRHKYMAKQGLFVAMGGIIFITAGGLLAQMHWSYPFAIYLLPLLYVPFLLKTLYETKQCKEVEELEVEAKLLPVYLTAFFVMVLFYMLPTQFPYLIVNELGAKPQTVGFVIATAMTFNALTAMQYAKIKARLSYQQIFSLTFALFGVGVFIISQVNSISGLYFATAPIGMGFGLLLVNTNAWFLSLVPAHKRGKASGALTSSLFLGQFSSPILFEPVVSMYGIQGLFFGVAVFAFVLSVGLFLRSRG